jgi:hypothetical protein
MRKWWHIKRIALIAISTLVLFLSRELAFPENGKVDQYKEKILSLALAAHNANDNMKTRIAFEEAIGNIEKIGLQKDELANIYIRLLDYYLGESTGEIMSEKITKMGETTLPFLVEKANMPLRCENKYRSLCLENKKERNEKITNLINDIKRGLIAYAEFPADLKSEHEKDLKIIRIFIQDYKIKKGILPKNLDNLREYAWHDYGYKLKIYSPWFGKQLKYVPQKDGKYILEAGDDKP